MLPVNANVKHSIPKRRHRMEDFDRLPIGHRRLLWNTPIMLMCNGKAPLWSIERQINAMRSKLAFEAYGPEHPEAQAYVAKQPTAEGLGL